MRDQAVMESQTPTCYGTHTMIYLIFFIRSATKRVAKSLLFYPCRTRRTEALMAARDQCTACVALLNEADLTEVGRLYGC